MKYREAGGGRREERAEFAASVLDAPTSALFEALRGVTWPARRRATGALPGTHRSRLRGAAPELSEYRLYRQGDDPRQLDWKLLARSDRAYIRLAEDRAILATWFVLDASASMAWPRPGNEKWRYAVTLTVALASVALAAGDPVALVVAQREGRLRLTPRSRRGALHELADVLARVQPDGAFALAPALASLRPGARIVIVSDFLGDEPDVRRSARGLVAAGSDVHAVHVVAHAELEPPRRAVRAVDPEDGTLARPLDEQTRAQYQERFAAWRDATAREWRQAGALWTTVSTGGDPVRDVRRIVAAVTATPAVPA